MTETCKNCRFGHVITFEVEDRIDAVTVCREKPPEFVPPNGSALKPVDPLGWCGRYAQQPLSKRVETKKAASCDCGMSSGGRCPVCMTVASC